MKDEFGQRTVETVENVLAKYKRGLLTRQEMHSRICEIGQLALHKERTMKFRPVYRKYYFEVRNHKDLTIARLEIESGEQLPDALELFSDWVAYQEAYFDEDHLNSQIWKATFAVSDTNQTMVVYEVQMYSDE